MINSNVDKNLNIGVSNSYMTNINDQRFIDINIDSENESISYEDTSGKKQGQEFSNVSSKTKEEKKSLFIFRKNSKSKKSLKKSQSDKLNIITSQSQNEFTNSNLEVDSKLGNGEILPQFFADKPSSASSVLTKAADILLSNLDDIDLNSYSDEEDEEDEEDLNDNEKSSKEDNNKKQLDLSKIFNSQLKNKNKKFMNSTLVSNYSINLLNTSKLSDKSDSNENEQTISFQNEHSTPLRSDKSSNSTENLNDSKLDDTLNSISSNDLVVDLNNPNDQTLSWMEEGDKDNSFNSRHSSNKTNENYFNLKKKSLTPNSKEVALKLNSRNLCKNDSIVDGLLGDIYDRFNISFKESFDSDVFTEMSSSRFSGGESRSCFDSDHESESKEYKRSIQKSSLENLSLNDLRELVNEMNAKVNKISTKLIRQLKQKDKLSSKLNRNCDVLTALLQAKSLKRRVDTQMKFTLNPAPGESGFIQWKDAIKALARLPGGVPNEFRKSVWLNLSQKYIKDINLDWNKVRRIAFNDRSNPDDDELGIQIVKDLHRTGCSAFSGQENEQDRALLKRVLLAFARYNKTVGYCQGFNIIAALILEIVDKKEEDAFMCMIYLIDHVLPEGYFTNSMHSLAIDMAVFREILKSRLPKLCQHLSDLQFIPSSTSSSKSKLKKKNSQFSDTLKSQSTYEPPLTNVFTMQWFLTLFATCLPKNVLLRVWDSIFLEGAEILFRTSIAIWDKLSMSIMKANSADAFYSMMSVLTIRLFDENVIDENDLINKIYSYGSFPLPGLEELREKFTFNITPFQICSQNSLKNEKNTRNTESLSNLKLNDKSAPSTAVTETLITTNTDSSSTIKNDLAYLNRNEDLALSLRKLDNPKSKYSNESQENSDDEVEDLAKMISCFALLMPNRIGSSATQAAHAATRNETLITAVAAASAYGTGINQKVKNSIKNSFSLQNKDNNLTKESNESVRHDISTVTPGAFSFMTQMYDPKPSSDQFTLDLNELKKQHKKLKERQRQAHIIIQTASNQHRLKNAAAAAASNSSNSPKSPKLFSDLLSTSQSSHRSSLFGKKTNDYLVKHQALVKSFSINPTPSSDVSPMMNHLLLKSNDPQCNTVKKQIQLNTDSPNLMLTESNYNEDSLQKLIKADLRKSLSDQINEKKEKGNKKTQQPYYSDDEDDDEDEDIEYETETENEDLFENFPGKDKIIKIEEYEIKKSDENNNFKLDEIKDFKLIDLVNLNKKELSKEDWNNKSNLINDEYEKEPTKEINATSSSSSSSVSSNSTYASPILNNKMNLGEENKAKVIIRNSKSIDSTVIINQLAKQEKRQMAPLNPFPTRPINSNVAKNGIRLGLYK